MIKHILEAAQRAQQAVSVDHVIASVLTFYVVFFIWRAVRRAMFTPLWQIPGPLLNAFTNIPLFYFIFRGKYHEYTTALHAKYGEVVRVGYNQVSVANVSELRRILSTHKFPKSMYFERGLFLPSTTFSTADPERNKTRRRQMGSTYSMPTVRLLEDSVIENGAVALIAEWDKQIESCQRMGRPQAAVNYFYGFHSVAVDIIGALGFGRSFNIAQTGNWRIIDDLHKLLMIVVMRSCFPLLGRFPWIAKPLNDGRLHVTRVAEEAIAKRKAEDSKNAGGHIDILQRFIDARDPSTGGRIEGPDLTSEIILLLIAGTDTSSNTLAWTMMHLLNHPDILHRLQQDIRQAFPDTATPIRYEQARERVPYLTAVFYESMRLHSAVSGYIPRSVPKTGATILDTYYLPPDTEICVSLAACHRNKTIWDEPERFNPERFIGPNADLRKRDVLAFGSGVRMCAGRNLAWIELYTLLANVLRKYNFELPEDAPYGPQQTSAKGAPGNPECIPGLAFTTFGPADPSRNCVVNVSRASNF